MRFSRLGSTLINYAAITHAYLGLLDESTGENQTKLIIWFIGGNSVIFYGDEALTLWRSLQLYSISNPVQPIKDAS